MRKLVRNQGGIGAHGSMSLCPSASDATCTREVFMRKLLATMLVLVACGSDATNTRDLTYNGTYVGSATGTQLNLDNTTGPSAFQLNIIVSGTTITGVLRDPSGVHQIPLSGWATTTGNVTFTASDTCGGAVYTMSGSIAGQAKGSSLNGSWMEAAAANCSKGANGTFTTTRQ